eukprot:scaffold4990_cov387-Prasinococcus_capsulatus_cf.AAC.29
MGERDVLEERTRRLAAKCIVFGFDGTRMNEHCKRLIDTGAGGVILFTRNSDSPEQLRELNERMKARAAQSGNSLLTMVDQVPTRCRSSDASWRRTLSPCPAAVRPSGGRQGRPAEGALHHSTLTQGHWKHRGARELGCHSRQGRSPARASGVGSAGGLSPTLVATATSAGACAGA